VINNHVHENFHCFLIRRCKMSTRGITRITAESVFGKLTDRSSPVAMTAQSQAGAASATDVLPRNDSAQPCSACTRGAATGGMVALFLDDANAARPNNERVEHNEPFASFPPRCGQFGRCCARRSPTR